MRLVCEEHDRDEDVTVGRRGDGQVKGEEGKFVPANGVGGVGDGVWFSILFPSGGEVCL